jgi:hypothetical protein
MNITDSFPHRSARNLSVVCSILLLLTACTQGNETPEATSQTAPVAATPAATSNDAAFEWAREALARNAQVELIASDPQAQVFTLRDKQSGAVSAVKLSELAAVPAAQLASTVVTAPEPAAAAAPESAASAQRAPTANAPVARASQDDTNFAANTATDAEGAYTIERSEGQVRVTGPGVSIVSTGSEANAGATASTQASSDPIICEGQRMLHFDNREFVVQGDAITVRGGCELYLTNSRVIATGTGIIVQDGIVHVSNSHVEGQEGSFDADNRAKVFVRGSTFRGLPRRAELAQVQDQGGNRWR